MHMHLKLLFEYMVIFWAVAVVLIFVGFTVPWGKLRK
jgi:hypothetical protein